MYNRYIPNDSGTYDRIPQEEPPRSNHHPPPPKPPDSPSSAPKSDGISGLLQHFLDQFHLDGVDTGDLLLLGLLFLLFRENADEELLVALGLLLIL